MWRETFLAAAAAGAACLARSEYEKKTLAVERFAICSPKIRRSVRFAFLSDLHNNKFGAENERLLAAIEGEKPDFVLSGGDMMVVKKGADAAIPLRLFERLCARYQVICASGNHERRMTWYRERYGGRYEEYRSRLRELGASYLEDSSLLLGDDLRVTGLNLGRRFYRHRFFWRDDTLSADDLERKLGPADGETGRFQILLAHTPVYFDRYADWGADLTLAGHFHGGTIRLPFVGGVMTPQYQFFYPYCGGLFERDGRFLAVSRGLGTHSINVRLNNLPQLMTFELLPAGAGEQPCGQMTGRTIWKRR